MSDLILHHYDGSPFAEKVRTMLGFKGLSWQSVEIPMIMPKPDYTALTGGYRKTPSLQIGADIFCDTRIITDVLEARQPEPSFYANGGMGLNKALETWADEHLFWPAVQFMLGVFADKLPMAFHEDRAAMRGAKPNVEAAVKAVPIALGKLQAHLVLLEDMLSDGRDYLLGAAPGLADFAAYHCVWSVGRAGKTRVAVEPFPKVDAWLSRMLGIGHGDKTDLDAKAALEIAAKATPLEITATDAIEGPALGSQVMVGTEDRVPEPVQGELVISTGSEIAVRRQTDDLGEIVVHFPRLGYVIKPV
jgi:glutathione S-transferase